MASILRLGSRQVLNQFLKNEKLGMLSLVRPVTLKARTVVPEKEMGHDERNMKLGRPQSPHLTIYAPQWTSMLSISHRATGMMLAGYTVLFSFAAVALPGSISAYLDSIEHVNIILYGGIKFWLAFPMCYHFWNGIRHLFWDVGMFLSLKEVYLTGYVMLTLAIGSTIALMNM